MIAGFVQFVLLKPGVRIPPVAWVGICPMILLACWISAFLFSLAWGKVYQLFLPKPWSVEVPLSVAVHSKLIELRADLSEEKGVDILEGDMIRALLEKCFRRGAEALHPSRDEIERIVLAWTARTQETARGL